MTGTATGKGPWHAGEVAMQARLGLVDRMAELGHRAIRDHMPDQHRTFFAQLPFLAIGTVDETGMPWATVLSGEPGFARSPDPHHLHLAARLAVDDPAAAGFGLQSPVGLLGIELGTRRRNRLNGRVAHISEAETVIAAEQSFGNCPQYIATRDVLPAPRTEGNAERLETLDAEARKLITEADIFFVATHADTADGRQVDISHRGGKPGFVHIAKDDTLTIPDFSGNRYFNTLGNILVSGSAGLVFVEAHTGTLLQVTGMAEIDDRPGAAAGFDGAERLWRVRPRRIVRRPGGAGLRLGAGMPERRAIETGAWSGV